MESSAKTNYKVKFSEGEKVLCFHGPLLYEAKVLKINITKDKNVKYYIHYAGWSKNWDEWVPENRVLKYNEANVQRQHEVYKQHNLNAKNKKAAKSRKSDALGVDARSGTPNKEVNTSQSSTSASVHNTPNTTSSRANRKRPATPLTKDSSTSDSSSKRDEQTKDDNSKDGISKPDEMPKRRLCSQASDRSVQSSSSSVALPLSAGATATGSPSRGSRDCVETEEAYLSKVEIKIKIPDELKQCLTDDWEAVTRNQKLLEIPAKVTVQDIVDQYIAAKKTSKSTNSTKDVAIGDIMEGILEYFNTLLCPQLLYKFERTQCSEVLEKHPDTPPSQLYGAFHLLRLFVRLGHMIAYSALAEEDLQIIIGYIQEFLKFLVKNSATYFTMSSFTNVHPEYIRNTQWAD